MAPSFVIITSPSGETNILSIPFGPNDVFKRLATVLAAKIFIYLKMMKIFDCTYLMGFKSLNSFLFTLFSKDDKRSS